jgi:hypothetical protein
MSAFVDAHPVDATNGVAANMLNQRIRLLIFMMKHLSSLRAHIAHSIDISTLSQFLEAVSLQFACDDSLHCWKWRPNALLPLTTVRRRCKGLTPVKNIDGGDWGI